MIEKSQDASAEEKKRQKDGVAEVMSYCRNTVQCRRVQVLNHFGQKFNAADCHNNCDNCMCDGEIFEEDMTAIAIKLVKLTKSMLLKKHTNLSKSTIIEVIRGSKSKAIITAGHSEQEFYGAAKELHRDKVGRLVDHLQDMEVLKDKVVNNKLGYANTYTVVRLESLCFALELIFCYSSASMRKNF
jgi:bloom syndrome protein